MKISHGFVSLVLWVGIGAEAANLSAPVQLQTTKTHSRILVTVGEGVEPQWSNSVRGFELVLKGVRAPQWGTLESRPLQDSRVKSISVQEIEGGIQISGKWKYPRGASTLAHPVMESYGYLQASAGRFVIDFWLKKGPTLIQAQEAELRRKPRELLEEFKKSKADLSSRKLASGSVLEANHGAERKIASLSAEKQDSVINSCGVRMTSDTDVFLDFTPVHQKFDFSKWISAKNPDTDFPYLRPQEENKEAQYVRLALNLTAQGNLGLTIRTLDFFREEFPKSPYQFEMNFLRANTLMRLGYFEEGQNLLKKMQDEKPDSPIALRIALYLSAKMMEKESPLPALENFLWLIQYYPKSELSWVFHLGAAECLYSLKETQQALKEYQWVIENAKGADKKAEAAYRMGDIYLIRLQREQALASYFHANEYFKDQAKSFPAYYINKGEQFYQLERYEEAKSVFEKFLDDFPGHTQGWRATYRLSEIAGRKEPNPENRAESRKRLLDTVNHYPLSPAAVLARMRLIPCEDHGGFNFSFMEQFFYREALDYDGGGEVLLSHYDDYRVLAHARALISLGTPAQVVDALIQELRDVRSPEIRKILIASENQQFAKMILEYIATGKKYEALSVYSDKIPKILPTDEVQGLDYLLALSRVASDRGLGKFALELCESYQRQLEKSKIDLNSRLEVSERNFSTAKALWVAGQITMSVDRYPKIQELLSKVTEESKFSYGKNLILGLIHEREGKFKEAVADVQRATVLVENTRVSAWLASLYVKAEDDKAALNVYKSIERKVNKSKAKNADAIEEVLRINPEPTLEDVALAEGALLEKAGQWGEAALAYSRAIENGSNGSHILYEYARTLIKTGDPQEKIKAEQTLNKLSGIQAKNDSDKFWRKLAEETLADEQSQKSVTNAKEGRK